MIIPTSIIITMVERGDKSDEAEKMPGSGSPVTISGIVPKGRDDARNSVINTLSPKKHPLELIGFTAPIEIRELPGEYRLLRINFPLFEQKKLLNVLDRCDLARPLSCLPAICSPQDKIGSLQTLVTSPDSLEHFRERARGEGIHTNLRLSPAHLPVLHFLGAASGVSAEFFSPAALATPAATAAPADNTVAPAGPTPTPADNDNRSSAAPLTPWESPDAPLAGAAYSPPAPVFPRLGPCSYAIFSLSNNLTDFDWPGILDHLEVLASSPDFHHVFDQTGNLVLIALHERAVGRLSLWAEGIRKITGNRAHLYLGKGEIVQSEEHNLTVRGFPSVTELHKFKRIGRSSPAIYAQGKILHATIQGSRDETQVSLTAKDNREGLVALNVEKRVNFRVGGGPDRLIGYQEEFKQIYDVLNKNASGRLIFLEGAAGTGKSRLVHEIAEKTPNVLKISIDPAGRNIAGFGLVDFADQIAVYLHYALPDQTDSMPPSVQRLIDFCQKTENEKLHEVNKYTETVCFFCLRTLEYLEENTGGLALMLDDAHHIDRFSDGHLMNVLGELLENETCNSRVVVMRRPEERYVSIHQDNLRQRIPDQLTVSLHQADGRPKLDFTDKRIAEDYIRYSLPAEIRNNPEDGNPRILEAWADHLCRIAKTSSEDSSLTPFEVTAFLNEILLEPARYLQIQTDNIDLTPAGYERMQKIHGNEMVVYYLERMREQLAPDTLKLLQVFALIGQKVASEDTLIEFMVAAFAFAPTETEWHLQELVNKGYLTVEESLDDIEDFAGLNPQRNYRIWHENVRDIVLNKTLDRAGKEDLADKVYQASQLTGLLSENQQFTILHYASGGKSRQDQTFWDDYAQWGGKALADAERYQLYGQGYGVASMILRELGMESDKNKAIIQTLADMMEGKKVSPVMENFIMRSLHALVENGYYLGQFSKVYQAISIAEEIATGATINVDLPRFHRFGFLTAYAQINRPKLEHFYQKLTIAPLAAEERILFDLKHAYRQGKFAECHQIIARYPTVENLPNEVKRLKIRIQLEEIINEVTAGGIDGDAVLSGLDLSEQQMEEVIRIRQEFEKLKRELSTGLGEGEMKTRLNPVDELHMLDMDAQLHALTGQYYQAMRRFGESWRVAMQMEVFQEATRAAKQKGDVAIFKALREKTNLKSTLFYRQALRGAIHTYTEDGLHIAERLDDKTWKFYLSVQRLRAYCLYLLTFDFQESCNLTSEIHDLLARAGKDIEFINQAPWTGYIPPDDVTEIKIGDYEVCYYITPLLVLYRRLCEDHEYRGTLPEQLPFETPRVVQGSSLFALQLKNDSLREKSRKFESLCLNLGK